MNFRIATIALLVTAVSACSQPGPATPPPAAETDAALSRRNAALTDWREALAQTLNAVEQEHWDDVAMATSWEWPQMADYRYYFRARAAEYAFQFTDAANLYAHLVSETPQSIFAQEAKERMYLAVASAGAAAAHVAGSEAWARQAVSSNDSARRTLVLGRLYEAAGRLTDATAAYRNIRVVWPASPAAGEAEARLAALDATGHPAAALTTAERKRRADALFAGRAYDTAFEAYGELLDDADSPAERQEFLFKRGLARFHRRRYTDALPLFRKALQVPVKGETAAKARFYEAFALSRLGQAEDAERTYQKLASAERKRLPEWAAQAQFKIALINLQEGRDEKAALHFERYLDEYPRGESRAEALWWLAWARYNKGKFEAAREAFAKRAAYNDELARAAAYWRARADEKLGNLGAARRAYAAIASAAPLHYYGLLSAARATDPVAAAPVRGLYFAGDATFAASEPSHFHVLRAEALADIKRMQEAEREYQAAAQTARSREQIYFAARALANANRYNAAQRIVWANFEPELLRADVFYTDLWEIAYPRAFADIVGAQAAARGTNPHIVLALMREESRYKPDVMSPANAYGLLQLIMPTAKRVAGSLGLPPPSAGDLYQPELNITLGTAYIKSLLNAYRNNFFLAFAGYNGGPLNVNRWLTQRKGSDLDEFVENIPFTETRNYVKKVTTSLLRYQYLYAPDHSVAMPFLTAAVADTDQADGVE